jgi:hypothetical protein
MSEKEILLGEILSLKQHIFACKGLLMCLYKRLFYVRNNYALKSDYEKNEIEIICYQTKQQIIRNSNLIREYENNLKFKIRMYYE